MFTLKVLVVWLVMLLLAPHDMQSRAGMVRFMMREKMKFVLVEKYKRINGDNQEEMFIKLTEYKTRRSKKETKIVEKQTKSKLRNMMHLRLMRL